VRKAFTLIEVVISASIMSLVLVCGYLCLNSALATQKLVEPRAEVLQTARVAMELMCADLRCACPLSRDDDFLGMHRTIGEMPADNVDFGTHNYTPKRDGEADFCQTSFFVDKDVPSGQWVLWRRRNPRIGLDPLAGGRKEEIARGVRGVRFEYSDGLDWYDSWGQVDRRTRAQAMSLRQRSNLAGLPQAVRITLWLDGNPRAKAPGLAPEMSLSEAKTNAEPPMVFQALAKLNLASGASIGGGGDGGGESPDNAGGGQ
jgi:prepilin-type N-terminal cleavage/methylation domain-containing protein